MKIKNRLIFTFLITLIFIGGCIMIHKSSDSFKNNESKSYYKLAQDYQFKGKLDSALIYYDKADQASADTPIILHERGLLKSSMKKYEEALVDLNKSIELTTDQKIKEVRISNRALTYLEMNRIEDACKDWKNSGKWGKCYVEKYCK